ncbi:MAG TPA: cobalamin-independent methionine synthase II family protein [Xanthobacteraceae bacterium]|jgi:5-methyltetrahydropteroyltriglutamate--homocysteine methyltransferase|nr:cobalamin-independent methionine synthase II family protein [Xanthobacteraceae bacterium]
MKRSVSRIITTHSGSLSRPPDLLALNRARAQGEKVDEATYDQCLSGAIAQVVRRQRDAGIDVPDDGEFPKPMAAQFDYGAWWNYAFARLEGFVPAESVPESKHKKSGVAELALTSFGNRRDWQKFSEFYQDPESTSTLLGSAVRRSRRRPVCTGPIKYIGQAAIAADIAKLKAAMAAADVDEGFMCSISPGSFARGEDLHYKTGEEFVFAAADAMHEEYKAIVDAGIVLQIDDPSLPDNWDMIDPEPPLNEFKKFERARLEALNHALRDLPADRIRYHICWGSWHGPHTTDIPLQDIIDLVLAVNAGAYSVEAGNVRHEHEWRVWQNAKLPDGKLLIPGVVSHATNIVEHPQVVADRIVRYAKVVGRENVIAGTDCGFGGRIHPQIAWAKLEVLAQGAKLASEELWR